MVNLPANTAEISSLGVGKEKIPETPEAIGSLVPETEETPELKNEDENNAVAGRGMPLQEGTPHVEHVVDIRAEQSEVVNSPVTKGDKDHERNDKLEEEFLYGVEEDHPII